MENTQSVMVPVVLPAVVPTHLFLMPADSGSRLRLTNQHGTPARFTLTP